MIQTPTLSEHRVDGHKGADEFDERGNIFGFEAAAVSVDLCCFQFADAKNSSVFSLMSSAPSRVRKRRFSNWGQVPAS